MLLPSVTGQRDRPERAAAASTQITAVSCLHAFVTGGTQLMTATVALVGPTALAPDRGLFERVLMTACRIGNAQIAHDCTPFLAVRPGAAVTGRGDQVGNLMGNGVGKEVRLMTLRDIEVEAQQGPATSAPLHLSGRLSMQIEPDHRVWETCAV